MNNFVRVLLLLWPYRFRFAASVACALLVALLWGANLTAVYPILKVFFRPDQNLQSWLDRQIELKRAEVGAGTSDVARLRSSWSLRLCERVRPLVHRYVPHDRQRTLALVMGLLVAGLAIKGVFIYLNDSMVGSVTQHGMFDLRNRLFRHSMKMELADFSRTGTGDLMARFTNDVETVAVGVETLIGKMIREPLKALACLSLACWVNWRLTLVVLALVPVAVLLIATIGRYMKRATRRYLESMSSIFQILNEGFQGIRVVKAFTMERHERRRFFCETKNYYRKAMRIVRLEALTSPATEMVGVGAITVALLVGASLVIGESDEARTHVFGVRMAARPMDAEELALLYTLLAGVSDPVRKLSNVYGRMQRAAAASDRLFAFLDQSPSIVDRPRLPRLVRHRRSVELREIEFGYTASQPVLNRVSLEVRFGETVALVGPNGCGKTTLVNLIPRFYDPIGGAVIIDGCDIRDVRLSSLRRQIGIVGQETVLFADTIANNIAYGKPHATRREIEQAAHRAYAHRFIEDLPDGYETNAGERGMNLSGGQRQRVALARAILRDPAILILDEATSALDGESELLIQRALNDFVRDRTTFIITHRFSTLELAHRIVVMNAGRIIDSGTHDELIRRCELYARLHEIHSAGRLVA